jgi:hypothetical protein
MGVQCKGKEVHTRPFESRSLDPRPSQTTYASKDNGSDLVEVLAIWPYMCMRNRPIYGKTIHV